MKKVLGIDIGGTKINFGLMNEKGELLKVTKKSTKLEREDILGTLIEGIKEFDDEKLMAIGISVAGFIDTEQGKILVSPNIKGFWGFHLKESLERVINIPVYVANDANMAALAEKWIGSAIDYDKFVMLTMGTGLGGAVYDSRTGFLEGSTYQGAELGHIIMYPNGRLCGCGQKGCAEKYIAGSSLSINYKELTGEDLKGPEIISILHQDDNAKKALKKLYTDLAIYLSTIKNIFDPQAVIIGGGFSETSKYWLDNVMEEYIKICNRPGDMKIIIGKFLNNAGIIGACRYAFINMDKKDG